MISVFSSLLQFVTTATTDPANTPVQKKAKTDKKSATEKTTPQPRSKPNTSSQKPNNSTRTESSKQRIHKVSNTHLPLPFTDIGTGARPDLPKPSDSSSEAVPRTHQPVPAVTRAGANRVTSDLNMNSNLYRLGAPNETNVGSNVWTSDTSPAAMAHRAR